MRSRCAIPLVACLTGAAHADLPPGFTRTPVWINQGVTSIAPLSDGRVLAVGIVGNIVLLREGEPAIELLTIPGVISNYDRGALGLCLDPGFSANGYFYVFYTGPGPYDLIARYTLAGNQVDPASRMVIWQNPGLSAGGSHHGGGIAFGPDGNLYIATGDQFDTPSNAQTLSNQHGKILRVASDGSIPPDNPFIATPGADPAIWAYGLRNPFRLTIDQPTGTLWFGDVGGVLHEEINRGVVAANYGWPFMEGPQCNVPSCAPFRAPVVSYTHGDPALTPNGEACVISGPIYRGTAFPPECRGNLFYADHTQGWIRRIVFDAAGNVAADLSFDSAPGVLFIVDLKLGPDGALYYAILQDNSSVSGGVYRIAATTGGNQPPVVVAGAQPLQGDAPLTVSFSSAGTLDPDNGPQPLTYLWAFGDSQTSTAPSPSHIYQQRGRYLAQLTVSDGADPVTSGPITITVGHAPEPVITTPPVGFEYRAGDTISFAGQADDFEDGPLPASALSWSFSLAHLNHIHPAMPPVHGAAGGSVVIPTAGHDPELTHYRIELTATDSDGITTTAIRDLVPRVSELQLDTSPSGIPVFLDGRGIVTPEAYESLVGFHHQVAAQPEFVLNSQTYRFDSWSGGQGASFELISPEGGASLTAIYTTGCYPNCDGSTGSPLLTANDFQCFINRWAAADPYVNCDGSTVPPVFTANDFQCFLNAFASGCL